MDALKETLAIVCGCEPRDVRIVEESDGRIVARVLVIGAGASKPTQRFVVGATASEVVADAERYVARRAAMFPVGGRAVVVDTTEIDPGDDDPKPRKGPGLRERIEALEARMGR